MSQKLDLTNVINVAVLGVQSGLAIPNINTIALFSSEAKPGGWGGSQEYAIYTNPSAVGDDFGTGSKAYKLAVAIFSQQPNPLQTNGYLVIIPRESGGAEKVEDAIERIGTKVYYFGILVDSLLISADLANLSAAVQALDKMLFYATSDTADIQPAGMIDALRTSSKTHSRGLYYSGAAAIDTQRFAAAYAGRALTTDFAGSSTAQTMHLKPLAGIDIDGTVNQTILDQAKAAGADVYVDIAGPGLFTSGANGFFDSIYNQFWLKFALQTEGVNFLRLNTTKIPQTEFGMESLKNVFRRVCRQAVRNGFAGPGSWTSATKFGDLESFDRNLLDHGFYIYSQPVNAQLAADRAERKAPVVQIAIKEQGALHSSNVIVNVNQ
jgi:hypothetical protein